MTFSERRFWFLLVDNANGLPYRGTRPSSVSLFSTNAIGQFRDAVQAEYADSHLKGVAPSDLLVYKNKAAFDNRNSTQENGEPLEENCPLSDDMGLTNRDPIYVAFSTVFLSALRCKIPFYNNILTAEVRDDWIEFQTAIPSSSKISRLYIRKSFKTIASAILNNQDKVIVTGTPGIGKSFFLIYLLMKLVQEKKRVLLINHLHNIYYDNKGRILKLTELPYAGETDFWTKDLWCLFDANYKVECDLGMVPHEDCSIVVSASPQRRLFNSFLKSSVPSWFFMPIWSRDELETVSINYQNATDWKRRFDILGGIPRWVLQDTNDDPIDILKRACQICSLDDCIHGVGPKFVVSEENELLHCLVHITSTEPYTTASVSFASQSALNIIDKVKGDKAKVEMWSLLSSCERNPHIAVFCRYFFEQYAKAALADGGRFACRLIGTSRAKGAKKHLNVPKSSIIYIDKVQPKRSQSKQLHIPEGRNYTALDAWIPSIGGFQMTIAKMHTLDADALKDLRLLQDTLYWVLPPSTYETFTHRNLPNITQYAILIPEPGVFHPSNRQSSHQHFAPFCNSM